VRALLSQRFPDYRKRSAFPITTDDHGSMPTHDDDDDDDGSTIIILNFGNTRSSLIHLCRRTVGHSFSGRSALIGWRRRYVRRYLTWLCSAGSLNKE